MKSLIAICSMLFITISATSFTTIENSDSLKLNHDQLNCKECSLPYHDALADEEPVKIQDINVYEIEEEVNIGFDTKQYLPEGFNPLKGLGDIDWNAIDLLEIEEEVSIDFDTKQYLPKDFNSLKGLYDLNWDTIELIELEEEVEFNFDTKQYLPSNFKASTVI